jgi:hypothetical protein
MEKQGSTFCKIGAEISVSEEKKEENGKENVRKMKYKIDEGSRKKR